MKRFQHSLTPVTSISGPGDSLANSDQAVQDGEMVFVRSTRQVFAYENPSVQVPDGVTIVASNFGAGKWILVPTGGGASYSGYYNTASAGALASGRLLDVTLGFLGALSDGTKVWVRSVRDSYTWYAARTDVADGLLVVNPTSNGVNPGRFIRDQIASPTWATQLTWFVDPANVAANDENSGLTALLPLKSALELNRRTKGQLITSKVDLYLISDVSELFVDWNRTETGSLFIHGSATPGHGTTALYTSAAGLTAKVDQNAAANTRSQITDAAVPTGTWAGAGLISNNAAPNKRVRFTTGTQAGAICWPQKDRATGKVDLSCIVQVGSFVNAPLAAMPARVTVSVNDRFVVESLVSVTLVSICMNCVEDYSTNFFGSGVVIEGVFFNPPSYAIPSFSGNDTVLFVGCAQCSGWNSAGTSSTTQLLFVGCHAKTGVGPGGAVQYWACHVTNTLVILPGCNVTVDLCTISQGCSCVLVNDGTASVGNAAAFDSADDGFNAHAPLASLYYVVGGTGEPAMLWGTGNTKYGVRVRAGCNLTIRSGTPQPVVTGGTAPNDFFLDPTGTARAWNEGAGTYNAALTTTWAHLYTALGATGFGGNCHNLDNGAQVITDTHS